MPEEEKGRASAFVLWRLLLPCKTLVVVVSTALCRPLAGSCLGTVSGSIADNVCVVSLSQSKVFSTKQHSVKWELWGRACSGLTPAASAWQSLCSQCQKLAAGEGAGATAAGGLLWETARHLGEGRKW